MNNLLFLDTETTGKDETARLVQLCWKLPGQVPISFLVKPPIPISFGAMTTHHITEKMVENEKPFCEAVDYNQIPIKESLQEILDHSILVAHNAAFDISILQRESLKIPRSICTMKVAQNLFDEEQYKLQYLRYRFGLEVPDGVVAHDAVGDVIVLEKFFEFLLTKTTIADMIMMTERPVLLRRIGFGKHRGVEFKNIPKDYLAWLKGQDNLDDDLKYTIDYYLNNTNGQN